MFELLYKNYFVIYIYVRLIEAFYLDFSYKESYGKYIGAGYFIGYYRKDTDSDIIKVIKVRGYTIGFNGLGFSI